MEENLEYCSQSSDAESCSQNIQRLDKAIQQLIATWEVSHENNTSEGSSCMKDCNIASPVSEKSSWNSCIPYVQPQELDHMKMLNVSMNNNTLEQLDSHRASFNIFTKSTKRKMDQNQYLMPSTQVCIWCRNHFNAHEPLKDQMLYTSSCLQCKQLRSNAAVDLHSCSKRPNNGQQHSWTFQENASQYYQYSCPCGFVCGDQLQLNLHRLSHMDFQASYSDTRQRNCNVFNQKSSNTQLHVEHGLGMAGQPCARDERHDMNSGRRQAMDHLSDYVSSYLERENPVCARLQASACMQQQQPFSPVQMPTGYMESHAVKKVMGSQGQAYLGTSSPLHVGNTASVFMDRCKPQYTRYSTPVRPQGPSHKRSLENANMERQMLNCQRELVQGCVRERMLLPPEGNQRVFVMGQRQNCTETAPSPVERNEMIRIGSPSSLKSIKRYLPYNGQSLADVEIKDKDLLEVKSLHQKDWEVLLIQSESPSSHKSSKQNIACSDQTLVTVGSKDSALLNVTCEPQKERQGCTEKDKKVHPHFCGPDMSFIEGEKLVKHTSSGIKKAGQASGRLEEYGDKREYTAFKRELQMNKHRASTESPTVVTTVIKTEQAELQIDKHRASTESPTVVTTVIKTEQTELQIDKHRTSTESPTVDTTAMKTEQTELQMDKHRTITESSIVVITAVKTEQAELQTDKHRIVAESPTVVTESPTVVTTAVKTEQAELQTDAHRTITESPTVVTRAVKTEQAELQTDKHRIVAESPTVVTESPTVVTTAVKTEQAELQTDAHGTVTESPTVVTTAVKTEQVELQTDEHRTITESPTVVTRAVKTEQVELQTDEHSTVTKSPTLVTTTVMTEEVELQIEECRTITESPTVVTTAIKTEQAELQIDEHRTITESPTVVTTTVKTKEVELQIDEHRTITESPTVVTTTIKTEEVEMEIDEHRTITESPTVVTTTIKTKEVELQIDEHRTITESPTIVTTTIKTEEVEMEIDEHRTITESPTVVTTTIKTEEVDMEIDEHRTITESPTVVTTAIKEVELQIDVPRTITANPELHTTDSLSAVTKDVETAAKNICISRDAETGAENVYIEEVDAEGQAAVLEAQSNIRTKLPGSEGIIPVAAKQQAVCNTDVQVSLDKEGQVVHTERNTFINDEETPVEAVMSDVTLGQNNAPVNREEQPAVCKTPLSPKTQAADPLKMQLVCIDTEGKCIPVEEKVMTSVERQDAPLCTDSQAELSEGRQTPVKTSSLTLEQPEGKQKELQAETSNEKQVVSDQKDQDCVHNGGNAVTENNPCSKEQPKTRAFPAIIHASGQMPSHPGSVMLVQTGPLLVTQSGGPLLLQAGGPTLSQSGGQVFIQTGGPAIPQSGGQLFIQTGGPPLAQSGGPLFIQTGGHVLPQTNPALTEVGGPVLLQTNSQILTQPGGLVMLQAENSVQTQAVKTVVAHKQGGGKVLSKTRPTASVGQVLIQPKPLLSQVVLQTSGQILNQTFGSLLVPLGSQFLIQTDSPAVASTGGQMINQAGHTAVVQTKELAVAPVLTHTAKHSTVTKAEQVPNILERPGPTNSAKHSTVTKAEQVPNIVERQGPTNSAKHSTVTKADQVPNVVECQGPTDSASQTSIK
ncbi:uncharacterized protein LOC122791701 [Protopterus annectens]|uniref:uncharacterized protein LOC122791701 n=1 Tax=Protopterus annectens TaxID=7888 RepID=UPI001CFB110D|nr:uncharacterized protein LOC122791701 [Protopterus annectens]XP_043915533.1 uncharacterized protein LOC122791701 [Protopterus annectens]